MKSKGIVLWGLAVLLWSATLALYAAPAPPKQRETPAQFLKAPVPDVKGKTFAEAAALLKQAGFTAADGGKEPTANKLNVDRVAAQDPAAGTRAIKGSPVKLKIYGSSGFMG